VLAARPKRRPYLTLARDLAGFAIIVLSLIAGSLASSWSGFPISGSVLGMIILLCLLRLFTGAAEIVRRAAAVLLYLLPALFVPLYVQPFSDGAFWLRYRPTLLPVVAVGVAIMITLTRFLTIRMTQVDRIEIERVDDQVLEHDQHEDGNHNGIIGSDDAAAAVDSLTSRIANLGGCHASPCRCAAVGPRTRR
jgi:putative effector of murein hydrolase LrgA (UPF0299 family)